MTLSPPRGTEVAVTPSVAGEYTLEVEIDGYDGPSPFIKFKGVTETVTSVRAWILGNNTHYSRTEAEVRAMFEGVNEIYRQAGMRFVVESVTYTNMPGYLDLEDDADYSTKLRTLCDVASNTGGLEFYFVDRIKGGEHMACNVKSGLNGSIFGIVVSTNAIALTLAHEVGHSCGLYDIYESHDGTSLQVTGDISKSRLPDDWGCNGDARFYPAGLNQVGLINRLLMHGFGSSSTSVANLDLSYGDVYGLYRIPTLTGDAWFTNLVSVGFAKYANRNPVHQ